jgi:hypothetical protein
MFALGRKLTLGRAAARPISANSGHHSAAVASVARRAGSLADFTTA